MSGLCVCVGAKDWEIVALYACLLGLNVRMTKLSVTSLWAEGGGGGGRGQSQSNNDTDQMQAFEFNVHIWT